MCGSPPLTPILVEEAERVVVPEGYEDVWVAFDPAQGVRGQVGCPDQASKKVAIDSLLVCMRA